MGYTKGEWEAEQIGNEGKCVIHTGDLSLPFVHTFPNRYRKPQVSSEEALANAQLIAQSPKMAQLLKRMVDGGWSTAIAMEAKEIIQTLDL